jgi:hypothetical protein
MRGTFRTATHPSYVAASLANRWCEGLNERKFTERERRSIRTLAAAKTTPNDRTAKDLRRFREDRKSYLGTR